MTQADRDWAEKLIGKPDFATARAVARCRIIIQSTAKLEADNAALRAEIEALRAEMLRREENERQNCINWGPCSANDDPMNKEPTT
jgi:16S rRNA G527 N7-methylase RsmG